MYEMVISIEYVNMFWVIGALNQRQEVEDRVERISRTMKLIMHATRRSTRFQGRPHKYDAWNALPPYGWAVYRYSSFPFRRKLKLTDFVNFLSHFSVLCDILCVFTVPIQQSLPWECFYTRRLDTANRSRISLPVTVTTKKHAPPPHALPYQIWLL